MYHKVDIVTPSRWWVSADRFEYQINTLRKKYDFVFLDDYDLDSSQQVVLTFDDGYENVYHHAFPILKKYKVPFEIFINGGLLGDWNEFDPHEMKTRFCSRSQLREMTESLARVQWHTWRHTQLPALTNPEIEFELTVSEDLRASFPDPHFRWFAYPSDLYDERSVELVRQRFKGALSVEAGSGTDRFQLNRVVADEEWNPPLN